MRPVLSTDPVAVAVEGDAEVAAFAPHRLDQIVQVRGNSRIRMVIREGPVDLGEQANMASRHPLDHRGDNVAGRSVAHVPDHGQAAAVAGFGDQVVDIGRLDLDLVDHTGAVHEVLRRDQGADRLHVFAIEGRGAVDAGSEHHLEAVVFRRIVRARHHDAGGRLEPINSEIEHRRRAQPDPVDLEPAGRKSVAQAPLQLGRRQPAVVAGAHVRAALARHDRAEGPADGEGGVGGQRLADDAPDVVFAQD